MANSQPDNIILCGFMGTGKSTVGRAVAEMLGWRFVDTDKLIEQREGRAVKEIFAQDGEPAFRALENNLCAEIRNWRKTVVATGGGIVVNPANRAELNAAGLLVCLDAPTQEILRRLSGETDRPLLAGDNPAEKIEALLAQRANAYGSVLHHIKTEGCTPDDLAKQIITLWQKEIGSIEPPQVQTFFDKLNPFLRINFPYDNPVFAYDLSRIKWLKGANSPQRFGLKRVFIVYAAVLVIILLVMAGNLANQRTYSAGFSTFVTMLYVLPFFAGIYSLIADTRYITTTANMINSEIVSGQWDILRLTELDERDILDAKHATATVRNWPTMTLDRILQTVPYFGQIILFVGFNRQVDYLNYYSTALGVLLIVLSFFSSFLLPYWRMRSVSAIGLAISARIRSTTYAILAGFATVLGIRMALFCGAIFSTFLTASALVSGNRESIWGSIISVLVTFVVYRILELVAMRYAVRASFYTE